MLSTIGIVLAVLAIVLLIRSLTTEEIIETNMFDKEEVFPDCTVQVLTNTVTGETSVGWWKNDNPPETVYHIKDEGE